MLGSPVLSGPQVFNFREVYAELQALAAVTMVDSAEILGWQLVAALASWPDLRHTPPGPAVQEWLQSQSGQHGKAGRACRGACAHTFKHELTTIRSTRARSRWRVRL